MHGMSSAVALIPAFPLVFAVVFASSTASASSRTHETRETDDAHAARTTDAKSCSKPSVEVVAGLQSETFALERCDGEPIASSVEKLAVMARPTGTPKAKAHLDEHVVERLERIADHFRKDGEPVKILLVPSAGKARSAGSYHSSGRALDFRIDGVEDEAVENFCKTMQDTGCGFYPNSGFVHIDARDSGAGHVAWIDVSKRGESPKYVAAWPMPGEKSEKTEKAEPEKCDAKAAPAREADARDGALPSLPAAVQVAPLEAAPKADDKDEPEAPAVPAKKHHRHHHHKARTEHTIRTRPTDNEKIDREGRRERSSLLLSLLFLPVFSLRLV